MARKTDSGWRDSLLASRHRYYGFPAPAAGMALPMVEYDRGRAVGLVSYLPVTAPKPVGSDVGAAYRAFGRLRAADGLGDLPFLTARYDITNWSFELFPHNDAARSLLGQQGVTPHWSKVTERTFVRFLYHMRDRDLPDLSPYGVTWLDNFEPHSMTVPAVAAEFESFPGQNLSTRRRNWEPMVQVPFRQRIPCMDVDLAVVGFMDHQVAALVDYKAKSNRVPETGHSNMKALASMTTASGNAIPAFIAEYSPVKPAWEFRVHCLNRSANLLAAYALGASGSTEALSQVVVGAEWVSLTESEWLDILRCARDV